jgi:hypothetical protein
MGMLFTAETPRSQRQAQSSCHDGVVVEWDGKRAEGRESELRSDAQGGGLCHATGHDAESTGRKCVSGEKTRQGGLKEQDSGICDRNSTTLGPTRLPTRSLGASLRLTKVGLQPTILLSRLDLLISTFRGFDWPCSASDACYPAIAAHP